MFLDYLLAVLIGCAGMAAVYQLATDMLLLHALVSQLTFAELALRELGVLATIFNINEESTIGLCDRAQQEAFADIVGKTCGSVMAWLDQLPAYQINVDKVGGADLSWRSPNGSRISLSSRVETL